MPRLTEREAAEAILKFGEELDDLLFGFDRKCLMMPGSALDIINHIEHAEHLDAIAAAFKAAGDKARCALDGDA